jgi:hypothetical protein
MANTVDITTLENKYMGSEIYEITSVDLYLDLTFLKILVNNLSDRNGLKDIEIKIIGEIKRREEKDNEYNENFQKKTNNIIKSVLFFLAFLWFVFRFLII